MPKAKDQCTFRVPVTIVGTVEICAKDATEAREFLDKTDLDALFGEMSIDDTRYGRPVKMKH